MGRLEVEVKTYLSMNIEQLIWTGHPDFLCEAVLTYFLVLNVLTHFFLKPAIGHLSSERKQKGQRTLNLHPMGGEKNFSH